MNDDTRMRVTDIIQATLSVERVTSKTHFEDDLHISDIGDLDLALALERTFEIEFPDVVSAELPTVGNVVDYIDEHRTD